VEFLCQEVFISLGEGMGKREETAIIIGAGPAGLTAAFELLKRTDIKPIIFEETTEIGGISRTVNYKGNRIDIGGHRFFSKSDRVMEWWQNILPVQGQSSCRIKSKPAIPKNEMPDTLGGGPDPDKTDNVMLIRTRLSHILFLRKLFDYPISLSLNTVRNLGIIRLLKATLSYANVCIPPRRVEKSLEDFFINRFGKELYRTFFKDYTEKVWGVPCSQIRPEWGAQRIKGLSIGKAFTHAIKRILRRDASIEQKNTETTLIEQFLYPKFGPGQMWEKVAVHIRELGGEIYLGHRVANLTIKDRRVADISIQGPDKLELKKIAADYFFSTMPVKDLIFNMKGEIPQEVRSVAQGLVYRDFITVGLLLANMPIRMNAKNGNAQVSLSDNWIYIQESDVKVGRLQIFNNWSPYMVKNPRNIWIGLEYFCNEGDNLWSMTDQSLAAFAIDELVKIKLIEKQAVLDHTVIRTKKTYPAYFGSFDRFNVISDFTDRIENLFLIGRNGMHKYNNQDHSMLTAMTAVENIVNGVKSKENIWAVNTEQKYHELK
jgi:protoporphyrinogen oxidase